jgi:hypothetical protein
MSNSNTQEGEVTVYKRTLKALFVAAAFGVAYPIQAAAMPTIDSGGKVVVQKSAPIVSEKVAGLQVPGPHARPIVSQHATPIVSEKTAGLNLSAPQSTPATSVNTPIVSEKTAGLNLPTQQQPVERVYVSSNPSFDWGDAGIGAGVMFGSLLAAVAAAGMVRRHHAHLAH